MSDEQSEQDKIRLKRLAKLQQSTSTASTPAPSPSPAPGAAAPVPSTSTPKPKSAPSAPATPLPKPAATVTPIQKSATKPTQKPTPTVQVQSQPQPTPTAKFTEPFVVWQDAVIQRVLRLTLSRDQAEASNWSLAYLKEVEQDLLSENPDLRSPLQLNSEWIDTLLLSRLSLSPATMTDDPEVITVLASLPPNESILEYLCGCWKRERAERYKVSLKKAAPAPEMAERVDVLNNLKRLIISYLGLVLDDPTTFPQDHIENKQLGALELRSLLIPALGSTPAATAFTKASGLQSTDLPALLQDLATAPDSETGVVPVISTLITRSGQELVAGKLDIGGGKGNQPAGSAATGATGAVGEIPWLQHVAALQSMTEVKAVAAAFPLVSNWDTTLAQGATPPQIEFFSLLGPFLRLSTFPDAFPGIASAYFPNPIDTPRGNLESAFGSLRGTLRMVQNTLFRSVDNIVRSSPTAREAVLSYLGHVVNANAKRAAMRVDPATVSTHGFVINLHSILLSFATPFMDPSYSKIDKIDPLFFKASKRIDIKEVTKMSADQQESDAFYTLQEGETIPTPNFISEVFFLCLAYLHIGPMHAIREHKGYEQQASHLRRQMNELEADTTWRGTPNEAQTQAMIDRVKKKRELYSSHLHAYEVQLFDTEYLSRCVSFGNLVMAWLVRMVDPKNQHPKVAITLPLPEETPIAFRMLPEYIIEDITNFLSFTSKYAPQVLEDMPQDQLVTFMIVFLSTPYMKNPYLKGQFVEIMFYLTRPTYRSERGSLGDVLNFNPLALKHLMPCLVHAYIEIEITGSHTQFYDKFNTRYYITQLLKLVWTNPSHRAALQEESRHLDRYVRFANLLMNDTTYLLDDAIAKLTKIVEIQKEMEDAEAWAARPSAERQEQEKLLREYEGHAKSDLELGSESLRLLKLFASETKEPFLTREIVDRLAAMLDMNLNMLAGPRCQELKVKEPEKYKFRPKELLSDVLQIYIDLGPREEFQQGVARDGRSYSKNLFERAERIARKTSIKSDAELAIIRAMVTKVEALKAAEEEDEAMGDIPDEFLDPITYDLMRDPVILPSSKTIIDRSSLKQHFLSDASDPFNRVPLKWEDITDAVELRGQIEEFLAQRRAKKLGATVEPMEDPMHVDS
ncbi:hypothetical protein T439DRAFT_298470 [Meredithblackwellia eburnea MCA 4105]